MPQEFDFDDLMRQVDTLINEDKPLNEKEPGEEEPLPELPDFLKGDSEPVQNFANGYGRGETMPQAESSLPAYNPDFQMKSARPSAPRRERRKAAPAEPREEPVPAPVRTRKRTKKEKKKVESGKSHPLLTIFMVLLLLLAGALGWAYMTMEQPMTDQPIGTRKEGAVSILLCGTDKEGTRTDTMMLLYMNPNEKTIHLVSLPRDTLTYTTAGNYAKLNSAFGRNNGKEDPVEGMENLMLYVADIVGYMPDGYMLVDLDCFVDAVDLMGGIDFDVPQDMYYEDPSQDLLIDLKEGKQHLNGYEAMGLVRFRKGYANQDLGRVEVQRQFIAACMEQWLSVKGAVKLPLLLDSIQRNSTTDLSVGNLIWLGFNAWRCGLGNLESQTLPGYGDMVNGSSVYVLYRYDTADLVNEYCNPYLKTIHGDDLKIAK